MSDIHDIPGTLSVERLERCIAGEVEHLRGLSEDEYVDIIFLATATIENSPHAMKLFLVAKERIKAVELERATTISYTDMEKNIGR